MYKRIAISILVSLIGLTLLLTPLQAKRSGDIYYQDQVAVLMYHHVHEKDTSSSTITSSLFQNQLQSLLSKGYHFISLEEFKQFMEGATVPSNAVLVTFDDGYQSFYTAAYPILKSFRIPAVNFVITNDLTNPLGSYIPSMSKEQINEMTHATNFIDIGCHTDKLHHKLPSGKAALVGRLDAESDDAYKQRVFKDTQACIGKLAGLTDVPLDTMAYPFGITSPAATEQAAEAGIRYAFTISPEMATRSADRLLIPRINAGSPGITPELLHRQIQRRVMAQPGSAPLRVDAAAAAAQLGGSADLEGGVLRLRLGQEAFTLQVNAKVATREKARVTLRQPVLREHGLVTIALDDLGALIGQPLVYTPATGKVAARVTPSVK
ncbi:MULTISPECIES: polysaccharide deacetylase family protein [unclassified Paenibacillus]|uniref:polysaccharide deacetylase family protein n=1 Tax=unclassified Paenibacillus TaxID=185978 RepID=UPI00277D287C|nr:MULTISPECIES: polysaccharide deacetylase family protein [unclassified Paenibacillus]MDQ0897036.1 peptidoglycan/xylan/chitin deacetylase (PgdA/CDA1 family) [Paenibacillus sp. V4I7]MDQ0916816.1 peptidoglycan/xylan/chitin deacetylase (PgdA/CDA1 family) [Paenibacillus sp. V4I5]